MDEEKLIDKFGKIVDEMLLREHIKMLIELPEGTMEPRITSSFEQFGMDKTVMDFYILLNALRKNVSDMMGLEIVDPEKKEDMIHNLLDLVKQELIKEVQDE